MTPENVESVSSPLITGTSETVVVPAPTGSRRIRIHGIVVGNGHASAGTWVAVRWTSQGAQQEVQAHVAAGQTAVIPFFLPAGCDPETNVRAQCSTAASVRVTAVITRV